MARLLRQGQGLRQLPLKRPQRASVDGGCPQQTELLLSLLQAPRRPGAQWGLARPEAEGERRSRGSLGGECGSSQVDE